MESCIAAEKSGIRVQFLITDDHACLLQSLCQVCDSRASFKEGGQGSTGNSQDSLV